MSLFTEALSRLKLAGSTRHDGLEPALVAVLREDLNELLYYYDQLFIGARNTGSLPVGLAPEDMLEPNGEIVPARPREENPALKKKPAARKKKWVSR